MSHLIGPLLESYFGRDAFEAFLLPLLLATPAVYFLRGGLAEWRRSRPQALVLLAAGSLLTLATAWLITSAVTSHDPSPTYRQVPSTRDR